MMKLGCYIGSVEEITVAHSRSSIYIVLFPINQYKFFVYNTY